MINTKLVFPKADIKGVVFKTGVNSKYHMDGTFICFSQQAEWSQESEEVIHVSRTESKDYIFQTELIFANYKRFYKDQGDNIQQFLLVESQLTEEAKMDTCLSEAMKYACLMNGLRVLLNMVPCPEDKELDSLKDFNWL